MLYGGYILLSNFIIYKIKECINKKVNEMQINLGNGVYLRYKFPSH